jgi:peptidoglycan/LPS O-acetylase OafA/YrhL
VITEVHADDLPDEEPRSATGLREFEQEEEAREHRRFPYVPALDGLRGIGVMFMLLYHADVTWVGDGAVFTVEMFFGLSGFLITSLFLVEHANTNTISLKKFWGRRAKRLLPAVLGSFVLVSIYAARFATDIEANRIQGDGISVLTYVSNWRFIFSDQSYFEQFTLPSPFQHTWSLAIEEQFYLIVAVTVFLAFRKWGAKAHKGWIYVTSTIAVVSAVWMAILMWMGEAVARGETPFGLDPSSMPGWLVTFLNLKGNGDPSRMYYGTDTRLQGTMVGMAMAFLLHRYDLGRLNRKVLSIASIVGLGGILSMFFLIQGRNVTWIYYGAFLAFDVFLIFMIAALMAPEPPRIVRWLSVKPLVRLGVLSYSLYVWHLPIYIFLDESHDFMPDWARGVQLDAIKIGATLIVAWLSFHFIEDPIRRKGLPTLKHKLVAIGVVVAIVAYFLYATSGYTPAEFVSTDPQGRPVVLFAGDSMPYTLGSGVAYNHVDWTTGMHAEMAATLGCGISEGDPIINGSVARQNPECTSWPVLWDGQIERWNPEASLVLVWGWELYDRMVPAVDGGRTELKVGTPEWREWFSTWVQRAVEVLNKRGGWVVILTLPCIDLDADIQKHPVYEAADPRRVDAVNSVLRDVATRNKNAGRKVELLDLNTYLCPDGRHYEVVKNGVRITEDGEHFTIQGSEYIWLDFLAPKLQALIGIDPLNPNPAGG